MGGIVRDRGSVSIMNAASSYGTFASVALRSAVRRAGCASWSVVTALLVLLLPACGRLDFDLSVVAGGDARGTAHGDAPVIGDGTLPVACASDPGLGACYAFDGNVVDGSGQGNDATASAVSFGPGVRGSAVVTTGTSRIDVAASASFAASGITVEGWVRIDVLPIAGGRSVVLDDDQFYSMAITASGAVVCDFGGVTVQSTASCPAGAWTHVACVGDASRVGVYVGGAASGVTMPGPLGTLGSGPVAIGTNSPPTDPRDWLVGAIDTLRVWRLVLVDAQICQAAGTC
jgi:hypothetical protein